MAPPKFPNEPPSEPPYLNATASWYTGDAWFLFANMIESCGYPTAKFIFEQCIKEGADIIAKREKSRNKRAARANAPYLELPSIAQIDAMSRDQICRWYERFARIDQAYDERAARLLARYISFRGPAKGFKRNVPPIKPKGARRRGAPRAAELPAMFEALKMKHPTFSKADMAEAVFKQHGSIYGKSAEAVERAERNQRKKNRKV